MNKRFLRELAENPDFISGIHNYCDRWCERCPFTSRCIVYATEKADEEMDDPEVHDINNAKFWQKLESIFKETRMMLAEWAEEAGVDLDAVEVEEEMERHRRERETVWKDELSLLAREYAQMVQRWFQEEFSVERNLHDDSGLANSSEEDVSATEAIEVIRWYQFFIAAKLMRAIGGSDRAVQTDESATGEEIFADEEPYEEPEDEEYDAGAAYVVQSDADGSAKVALIAISRSDSAWRVLHRSFPEKSDSIIPLLAALERLRLSTEATFPNAYDFIRPGFDEESSQFIS
ncbi:MAG TPA: hypothetical protein VGJ55_11770 [Pyrinomonadaceae bacterium]